MSEVDVDTGVGVPADKPVQLGLLLRKAREARGMSIDDVVQTLKFRARQIEALEADEMPIVAGDVFSRGLIRSYARFLKLDPEPLLALLEADGPLAFPEVREPENMGTAMPRGGWRQIPLLVMISLALLVIAGALAAWHFFLPESVPALAMLTAKPDPTVVEAPTTVPLPAPTDLPAQQPALPAQPIAPPIVAAGLPTSQPTPAIVVADGKKLVFDFRGKAWIEVKDASQRVIFTGQYVAGSHEVISGRPPLQLVVGNANDVRVEFDDHPVDLKPYIRAEVARLTLE